MNFQPELARKVLAGDKTVTRRLVSQNPRSPWFEHRCGLEVGRTYAVCPGRGKRAVGRVRVLAVRRILLGPSLSVEELRREGFESVPDFLEAWRKINGEWDPDARVWRVEFERWSG